MRQTALALSAMLFLVATPGWAGPLEDGRRLLEAGDYTQAIPLLQAAAKAAPDDPTPHELLYQAYEATFQITEALAANQQALVIHKRLAAASQMTDVEPAAEDRLPPVYVRPGPRQRLPVITQDSLPKTPGNWKAIPIELPVRPSVASGTGDGAQPAAAPTPTPTPTPVPSPTPNFRSITEPNRLPYDPAALEPVVVPDLP